MMSEPKKALTERQARNCEEAKLPRCRCRCGGLLHGAKRGGVKPERSFYEALPKDDPHCIPPKIKVCVQLPLFDDEVK